MIALTSLSPAPARREAQLEAVQSWRAAGLLPMSLNHPDELAQLHEYDVELVPCAAADVAPGGRYCVTVNALLALLAKVQGQSLLLNSDIVLRLTQTQLAGFGARCAGGLGYLVKYNHGGDEHQAVREPYGIDAFLFDARTVQLGAAYLALGLPVWDYWLPYEFMRLGRPLYTTDDPVAFHRTHPQTWSMATWDNLAVEFCRVYGLDSPTPADRLALFRGLHAAINKAPRLSVLA